MSAHIPLLFYWPTDTTYLPATLHNSTVARGSILGDVVTELRDVFPTFLDAAGAQHLVPSSHVIDGASLLCLLNDPTGTQCHWRKWLDMEHDTCYNNSNHWSALTDGNYKYVVLT